MPIDTAKLDAQIEKLQDLKRIATDPELAPLLESLFSKNGDRSPGGGGGPLRSITLTPSRRRKGDLLEAARSAVQSMEKTRFGRSDLRRAMEESGYRFRSKNPDISVNSALRQLVREHLVKIAVQGSGQQGSQYERIES